MNASISAVCCQKDIFKLSGSKYFRWIKTPFLEDLTENMMDFIFVWDEMNNCQNSRSNRQTTQEKKGTR